MRLKILGLCTLLAAVGLIADSFGGAGAGGGAVTAITKTTIAAPAANITFSSIPATYNTLYLTLQGASATAAADDNLIMQVNGDTGTNYNYQQSYASNGVLSALQAAATASPVIGGVTASTGPANGAGIAKITIPNYAATTFQKMASIESGWLQGTGTAGLRYSGFAWYWTSTSAITSVTLKLGSGSNFVTGTVAILYGIN